MTVCVCVVEINMDMGHCTRLFSVRFVCGVWRGNMVCMNLHAYVSVCVSVSGVGECVFAVFCARLRDIYM